MLPNLLRRINSSRSESVDQFDRVMFVAKELEPKAHLVEKYYGAKYNVEKIDPKRIEVC